MAQITLDNVTKVYPDGTEAVTSLNLAVPDGKLMVLVGPSGCGKTTALRMVAGLEEITGGTIRIGDRVINDVPPRDRDIAMVFQNYALYPHMTVYQNMALSLKVRKVSKREIRKRVDEAARILGLADLLQRKPKALSGGQRQRVAMGRAIVRNPAAYLMDEPLSNLDAQLRVEMRSEISRLQQDLQVTTIYVTHDQTEALTLGDQVAVMRKGLLQQVAAPKELYTRPANLFVAGFIGSPAMNMVEATMVVRDGDWYVSFAGFELRLPEEVRASRPALATFENRKLILGIRPEDMEDASIVTGFDPAARMRVVANLREETGSDAFVHFEVDAPPVVTEETKEVAADRDAALAEQLSRDAHANRSRFVARVSPRTRARSGEPLELSVETRHLHFFDPETGNAVPSEPLAVAEPSAA
ncbi:MAG: sn-glycerol-3-phosphate ABC transporter ATP-binding protein UgpC [Gemmatimonadaceae bacterium]|nr:sn-glycerol-3-phosphate ABC transporter ATP-binding protein UgpC [Gemmatimonadaceae bacterium]